MATKITTNDLAALPFGLFIGWKLLKGILDAPYSQIFSCNNKLSYCIEWGFARFFDPIMEVDPFFGGTFAGFTILAMLFFPTETVYEFEERTPKTDKDPLGIRKKLE